jgi:hypothetical protein
LHHAAILDGIQGKQDYHKLDFLVFPDLNSKRPLPDLAAGAVFSFS